MITTIEDIYLWYDVKYLIPKNKCSVVAYGNLISSRIINMAKFTFDNADKLQEEDLYKLLCCSALISILKDKKYHDKALQSTICISVCKYNNFDDNTYKIYIVPEEEIEENDDIFSHFLIPVFYKDISKATKIAESFIATIEKSSRDKIIANNSGTTSLIEILSIIPLNTEYFKAQITYNELEVI